MIAPADRCATTAAIGEWVRLVAPEITGRTWAVVDVMQPDGAIGEPPLPYAEIGHSASRPNGRPGVWQTRDAAGVGLMTRGSRQQWTGTVTVIFHGPGAWDLAHLFHLTAADDRVTAILDRWAVGHDPAPVSVEDQTEPRDDHTWIETMKVDLAVAWETRLEWPGNTIETAAVEIDADGETITDEVSLTPPPEGT